MTAKLKNFFLLPNPEVFEIIQISKRKIEKKLSPCKNSTNSIHFYFTRILLIAQ
jgi:hypothetical protein